MKKTLFIPALLILGISHELFAGPLAVGTSLPALSEKLKNVDGKEKLLSEWLTVDKPKLVIFSCNPCPYSKAWEDRILAIGREFKDRISIVMVNSNDPNRSQEDSFEEMKKRAESKKYPFPYLVDATSNAAHIFGATKTPEAFLFSREGKLVYHGAVDDSSEAEKVKEQYLRDTLSLVVNGKTPQKAETKFIGCTIKFRS